VKLDDLERVIANSKGCEFKRLCFASAVSVLLLLQLELWLRSCLFVCSEYERFLKWTNKVRLLWRLSDTKGEQQDATVGLLCLFGLAAPAMSL